MARFHLGSPADLHVQLAVAAGSRHDERWLKRSQAKDIARTNTNLRRSQKHMERAVRDVRVAGLNAKDSPDSSRRAMAAMVAQTSSYSDLMRPQIGLMEEMYASNTRIQDLAQKDKLTRGGHAGTTGRSPA